MNNSARVQALRQAERCDPDPYKPAGAYVAATTWLVEEGYLERGLRGGFTITAAGWREIARRNGITR